MQLKISGSVRVTQFLKQKFLHRLPSFYFSDLFSHCVDVLSHSVMSDSL